MKHLMDRAADALIAAFRRSSAYADLRRDLLAQHERPVLSPDVPAAAATTAPPGAPAPATPQDIYLRFASPGHYYSTIPDHAELVRDQARIFDAGLRELPGVTIDAGRFRERLAAFASFHADWPYTESGDPSLRFRLDNTTYSRGDAVVLYAMMRLHRPRRIVEIGSGMSTALMLDVDERFLGRSTAITTIDPYPERMLESLHPGDRERLDVVPHRIQEVPLARFAALAAGDFVFVDSTHVSRCDSDVNRIFFDILPALAPGVLVHFHDTFWPFEYPRQWLLEIGAAWNEAYLMRAFLQYNSAFEIDFFSDYVTQFLRDDVGRALPVFLQGPGSSLWMRRVR